MNPTLGILQGELERLFTLNELLDLCRSLLGFDPEELGGKNTGKAAFVRLLVDQCERTQSTIALADAVQLTKTGMVDPRLKQVYSASIDEELSPGTKVASYEVVELSGSFSLGQVYWAKLAAAAAPPGEGEAPADSEAGERPAVEVTSAGEGGPLFRLEVTSAGLTPDVRAVRRYLTALRAIKRREHRGLPKLIEAGTLPDGRPFAVMEPINGAKPLSQLLEGGPRPISDVWPILKEVLGALCAIHESGLAHGDLKVENVLVSQPGDGGTSKVQLIGLGSDRLFSRPTRDDRETGPLLGAGTPRCMAPEQARGKAADHRTDLYALGVMLYEILTGRAVFTGRSGIDMVAKHLTEEPRPPSATAPKGFVPEQLDSLVLKLLSKDPLRRPSDVMTVFKLLELMVADQIEAAAEPQGSVDDARAAADALIEAPEKEEHRDQLEEAARAAKAWEVAVEAYEMAYETVEDEDLRKELRLRLARVLAVETKDTERAEGIYQEILEKDPNDVTARPALVALLRSTKRHEQLIEQLLQRVERTDDQVEKASILREVGYLYEKELGRPDDAMTVLFAVLQREQDEELLSALARLAGQTGKWNDVVQACSAVVQTVQEPAKVVLITINMGRWYGEQLGRQDYALPCYQQALAIEPSNDEALKGMEEIFRRQQQWLELTQVLLSRAEAARYPADRRDRLAEAAEIFASRLTDDGRAVELYQQILADDPAHEKSVAALERIYTRTEDWAPLIKLYRAKDEALAEPSRKAETRYFMAEVYEDRLKNDQAAIDAYQRVLEVDGGHVPTLKGLERLYARTGEYRALLGVLATQRELATTPRQRVSLHERRAQIFEEEFRDREEALAEYGKLLAIAPDHEQALTAVLRLHRALEHWVDLDDTFSRLTAVTNDKERRALLLKDRAELLIDRIDDAARAAAVLTQLAELQPKNVEVLDSLAKQRLRAEDLAGTVEALERLAEATGEGANRASVWVRIGELLERRLHDSEGAEQAYRKALDSDKANVVAAAALHERYAERGDMTAALDMLERQLNAASGELERSRIYTEMGEVCREKLNQPERAVEYYEKALSHNKSNSDAAEPLAEIHRLAGRWDQAVAIYDRFSDATSAMPPDKKLEFFAAWGEANIKLGDFKKAEKAFASAVEVDVNNGDIQLRLADVFFRSEQWKKASDQYRLVLGKFVGVLEPERLQRIHLRQGIAREASGDLVGAGESLDKVLELEGSNVEALRHRVDVHRKLEEFEAAAKVLEKLAGQVTEGDQLLEVLTELGDLYADELVEHEKAATAYSTALNTCPDDRNLLMRLMRAYSNTKQWSGLVEVVLKIADMESDAIKMARYYQTAAMIAHKELGRIDEAREYYETALEQDPTLSKSFEALAELLTAKEAWEDLVEAYKTMLGRLPADATNEQKIKMYDALGELLLTRQSKPDEAIPFFEKALALDHEDRPRKETLVRLYGDKAAAAAKSIPLHHQLLTLNPFRAESYRELRRIYSSTGQWDQQWCCARTLVALRMAEDEEEQLYNHFKLDEIPTPGDCLTDEQWQNYLLSRQQDRNITSIFETIIPAVLSAQARPHKAFDLDPKQARDLDTDDHPFSGLVKFASATLGTEPPKVFFREKSPESAVIIQTNPPGLLAGEIALNAAYQNPRALAFIVGRQLAYFRGGNLMRVYVETGTMMRAWLLAALKHVQPRIPIPPDLVGTVTACSGKLSSGLGLIESEQLRTQVTSFIDSAAKVDLKEWATCVDYSADRAGFLLCDDLEMASQLIRLEQGSPTPTKDRLKELNLFSVSPEYFALRQKLLIHIRTE